MSKKEGPWRITFDTNPDNCNLKCIMCEEHSILQLLSRQKEKKKGSLEEEWISALFVKF